MRSSGVDVGDVHSRNVSNSFAVDAGGGEEGDGGTGGTGGSGRVGAGRREEAAGERGGDVGVGGGGGGCLLYTSPSPRD